MSDLPGHTVACPFVPDLDGLPGALRTRVAYDPQAAVLRLEGDALESADVEALRNCHADVPEWQLIVDRLASAARVGQALRTSAFPSTMWGLLLVDLATGEDAHWRRFIERYRGPIGAMVRKTLALRGVTGQDQAALADDFINWFYAGQIHRKLSRTRPDGSVNRFRGYLRLCIRTFVNERLKPARREGAALPEDAAETGALDAIVDEELCRNAIAGEMDALRRHSERLWQVLVESSRGMTLAEIAAGMGKSIGTAHGDRQKAMAALRGGLLRYRLRDGVVTEEDAEAEYAELIEPLARMLGEYVAGHAG